MDVTNFHNRQKKNTKKNMLCVSMAAIDGLFTKVTEKTV